MTRPAPRIAIPIVAGCVVLLATFGVFSPASAGAVPSREKAASPTPASADAPGVAAAAGDVGWEGPSFAGASGSPSGSKPESKLWYNDGKWWASLFDASTGRYFIYRLDLAAQAWVKTNTALDPRPDSRSDALWDGNKLYVASYRFKDSSKGSGPTPVGPSYPANLYRYSYNTSTDTYSLDAGFPTLVNQARTETLVLDEDSTGALWATWRQDANIMVARSTAGGTSWGTPFVLPGVTGVTADDISSVLAFGGNRIGIMWSDQNTGKMMFKAHLDGAPNNAWSNAEVAYQGTDGADDHINLKGISDQGARILAAVKTSNGSSAEPLVNLLDRNDSTGTWSARVFGTVGDSHTRPIVVIDTERATVHMFATAGQSGGSIYEKTAPLSNITFPPGVGTPVLTDADSADINNASSTKQNVNGTTGLVVLATNDTTDQYWTHFDDLGGPLNGNPVASAGPDQNVVTDATVTLDASGSTDGGAPPLSYLWQQTGGAAVVLSDPTRAKPTFKAPSSAATLTFKVTVQNALGRTATDDVTINVAPK